MSQQDLADSTKLTRQSIGAIESGRVTPSVDVALRLAKILECTVEALFDCAPAADMIAAEAAPQVKAQGRLALAHIGGRWVAHSLQRDGVHVAADALASVVRSRDVRAELLRTASEARDNVLIAGCAAGLGLLADRLNAQRGAGRFVSLSCSSTAALEALAHNRVHVAGVHLIDAKTGDANLADVRRLVRGTQLVLVSLARWEMGLVVAPAQAQRIRSAADLARRGLRIVAREQGSGARRLLERELRGLGVASGRPMSRACAMEAHGHLEVAQAVAMGAGDTGVATRDVAIAYGLSFLPLVEERYDLVLRADSESDPRVQRLLNSLNTRGFRRELSALGYDVRCSGDRIAQLRAA